MEVTKQLSDTGSFLDYSQGPSNIDVHAVYNTHSVGASKGLLSSHNLATYVLEGHNDQQYRQAQEAQLNDAEAVEVQEGENQENEGDAEVPLGEQVNAEQQVEGEQFYADAQQHVEGSSHVVRAENVERIGEAYQTEVDPTVLNSQAVEHNQQQSSNLVTKQHELVHDGQEIKHDVVNQGQEVHAHHTEHIHNAEHVHHAEHVAVPETVVAEPVHTHTQAAQPTTTEVAAAHQENTVEQNQTQPAEANQAGLSTKGTITFKPIEFRFAEKNDKLAKVKPIFKAKVGGHHKASHAGKFENETFTWGEQVVVGYSNQDDATLEVKKAGMFGKTIAAGKIPLGDIIAQRINHTLNVQLLDKEKTVGELKVEVEFKPKAK